MTNRRGNTLLDFLIVIVIIGVLVTIIIPPLESKHRAEREHRCHTTMELTHHTSEDSAEVYAVYPQCIPLPPHVVFSRTHYIMVPDTSK